VRRGRRRRNGPARAADASNGRAAWLIGIYIPFASISQPPPEPVAGPVHGPPPEAIARCQARPVPRFRQECFDAIAYSSPVINRSRRLGRRRPKARAKRQRQRQDRSRPPLSTYGRIRGASRRNAAAISPGHWRSHWTRTPVFAVRGRRAGPGAAREAVRPGTKATRCHEGVVPSKRFARRRAGISAHALRLSGSCRNAGETPD
jgi:hypothetical protein